LEDRMDDAEALGDSLAGAVADNDSDISGLDTRLTTAEGDITALEGRMDDAETRGDSLAGAIASNDTDIQTLTDNLNAEISATNGDVDALNDRADSLALAVSGNDGEISGLDTRLTTAEGDITALEGRMDDAEARGDSLAGAIASNDGDISDLEDRMDDAEARGDSLAGAIADNDSDISGLDTRLTTAEGDIDDLEDRMDDSEARADSIVAAVASNDSDIQDLQDELDATQTGAGLNADGSYSANGAANYIASSTSLADADDALDAGLQAEVDRATDREDSIIDVLYWNLGPGNFDPSENELTLDPGIDNIDLENTDVQMDVLTANSIGAQNANLNNLWSEEADIDDLQADNITSSQIITQQIRWTHALAWGTASTTDLEGTLNVDGVTTLNDSLDVDGNATFHSNTQTDGNANIDGNLTVDGWSDLDSLHVAEDADFDMNVNIDGNSQTDGNANVDGDLDVDGTSNLDNTDIDGTLDVSGDVDFHATLDVTGNTDIDGTLDVDGDTEMDTVNVAGSLTVADNADLNSDLDVDGVSNLDNTDIDGTLDVSGDVDFHSTLDVTGNTDIDGTLDVDGNTELDTTNIDGSLTVRDFADFNDSLDVEQSVNIQDNLDVNDSLSLNTANNEGRVLTVYDSQGGLGVTIETMNTSGSTAATVLTTHQLVVQDDAVYNGDMNVNGALAVTSNITSAAAPTSPNHITNKQYVDSQIAAAITPPQVFDYDVTSSTNNDTVYYINGDLLMYQTMESGQENYEITVYGADLDDVTGATLRARGNSLDLYGVNEDWTAAVGGASATFNISYSALVAQLGGQTDGYISTHLVFTTATATYQSGLTIRFFLDSTNSVASGATFTDPD
jgi:predicted  nucleic acid-binding Zn-ribbon protein/cytoskeletal protein CcmA (bactofilin family)